MIEYVPRPHFLPFHNRKQRWAALNTHRRAGKTVALVNDVIVGALQCPLRKPQLAYVGPTFTQAKRIAWQYLKDYAEPYFSKPPSESELKVTLHGDRTIYCLGSDNPDSLRGMYLDGGVGDEYALFRPSTFSTIIRPALSDRNGWWVFASTPRGRNLFYKTIKTAQSNPDEWYHLTLQASVSGIIPPDELAALRRDMDPEEYAQEYECSFDAALKGAIYADEINQLFAEAHVRYQPDIYTESVPTNVVFDLGFTDSTVAIFWQEMREGPRVVAVKATQGKDIFHHIDQIRSFASHDKAELGQVYLPHDAKARNLQTGRSIVEQFLSNGIRPTMVPAHKVRDRIAATRRLFPSISFDSGQTEVEDLIEALKGYRREWDENTLTFSEHPLHDWCSDYADAFGYMCVVASPKYATSQRSADDDPSSPAAKRRAEATYKFHLANLFADNEQKRQHRARIG
jgi:hypothetical protein